MGRVNRLEGWRDADGSEGEDVQPDPFRLLKAPLCTELLREMETYTWEPSEPTFHDELMKRMARAIEAKLMTELFSPSLHDTIQEQWPW